LAELTSGERTLHYQVNGDGETLVLIHGLGANLAFWYMGIGSILSRRYRVVTYDLRGHGRSSMPGSGYGLPYMARDLEDLLDHLGVDQAHVVGHSFGARVALFHAMSHPERVKTLTVADTQVTCLQPKMRMREWPSWPRWRRQLEEQGVTQLPRDDDVISFRLLANFNHVAPDLTHGGLARSRRPKLKSRDMGRRGAVRWQRLMSATTADTELDDDKLITVGGLRQISRPTLAVFGEHSHCLQSCWKLRRLIPDCQVAVIPGTGHFHPAVKPRAFLAVLNQFLRGQDVSGSEIGLRSARFLNRFEKLQQAQRP
jgi:pimeloyl-ACP methyl ester carboxylesterase